MSRLPVDVKLARMLVAAQGHGCLARDDRRSPRSWASRTRASARPTRARRPTTPTPSSPIRTPSSSASSSCGTPIATAHEDLTQSKLRDWCEQRFLWLPAHARMARTAPPAAAVVRGGGLGPVAARAAAAGSKQALAFHASLHRALIAGLPAQIGHRTDKGYYERAAPAQVPAVPGLVAGQAAAGLGAGGHADRHRARCGA